MPDATERLAFRLWRESDAEAVLEMYGREEVYRFLGSAPAPLPDADAALERIRRWRSLAAPDEGLWAITIRSDSASDRPVGSVLLLRLPRTDGAVGSDFEIGWHLHPDVWGHGYATEAAGAVIGLARRLGLNQVRAVVFPDNARSFAVCRRLGMSATGLTDEWYRVTMQEFVLQL
jgi:RimJ/RimL family protein N-acetyltransferase